LCVMRLRIISLEVSKEKLERKVKKQKSKLRENKAEIASLNRDNKTLKASLDDVLAEQKHSRTPPPSEYGWEEEEWHSGFRRCPRILNSMNGYDT
jgi:TFIIF-interacting CTD phosphatase-like protein